jgi:DNA-binding transcriptional ArsR family regulator
MKFVLTCALMRTYTRIMNALQTRDDAALACIDIINTDFFRALCEPARVQIFSQLVRLGRSDIGTIAEALPQDRSVIARHLQLMERAGLVQSETEGRHTFYDINGQAVARRVESIANLIRSLIPICCAGK